MGVCASKPTTRHEGQHNVSDAQHPSAPLASPPQQRRATAEQKEAVADATEQAKDAVQQAGQQVQSQVKELELMQKEIERLKQAPVSVSEDAQNQSRIRQLEHDVLRVREEINVALEIAEHEVKEAVLTAQASLRRDEGNQHVESQAVPAGTYASNNSTVSSTNTYPPGYVPGTQGLSSADGVGQDPHGALADETISLDSASHSVGASRAALAGSSFADSETSVDRQSYHGLDIHGSAYDYGSQGASGAAPAPETGVGSFRPGVQVSSTPILGGEGTYTVQPLSYASPPAQQQQQIPATVASHQVQGQNAPPAAAAYSRLNSNKGVPEARQVDDSSAIEVGRSSPASEALQRGRAEAANSGLQDERSLRSFFSSGRDSPDFRCESIGHSNTGHSGQSQASGPVSQYSGPGTSQNGMTEIQEDGQAEDLVSDVHARAQSASQAAVVAGQEQQQMAHHAAVALKESAPARPQHPPGPGPFPPSATAVTPDASPASLELPQMTHFPRPQVTLSGPSGVGGEIDWARVQEVQNQAYIATQESMEQSRKGLMEVKKTLQRRAQMP